MLTYAKKIGLSLYIGSSIIVFAKRLGFQVSTFFAKIHVKTAATASEVVVV